MNINGIKDNKILTSQNTCALSFARACAFVLMLDLKQLQ